MSYPKERFYLLPNELEMTSNIDDGSVVLNNRGVENTSIRKQFKNEPALPNIKRLTRGEKIKAILAKLLRSSAESDLKLSLYMASCSSIPNDVLELEFSPGYREWLLSVNKSIPSVPNLISQLSEHPSKLCPAAVNTLYWLLVGSNNPRLIKMTDSQAEKIFGVFSKPTKGSEQKLPGTMFLVNHSLPFVIKKTDAMKKEYGFLAANFCDVFSLIYHWKQAGLHRCFCDNLMDALNVTNEDNGWAHSSLGNTFRTILVLEYYPHPEITFVGDVPGPDLSLFLRLSSSRTPNFYHINSTDAIQISHIMLYNKLSLPESINQNMFQVFDLGASVLFSIICVCIVIHCFRNLQTRAN